MWGARTVCSASTTSYWQMRSFLTLKCFYFIFTWFLRNIGGSYEYLLLCDSQLRRSTPLMFVTAASISSFIWERMQISEFEGCASMFSLRSKNALRAWVERSTISGSFQPPGPAAGTMMSWWEAVQAKMDLTELHESYTSSKLRQWLHVSRMAL